MQPPNGQLFCSALGSRRWGFCGPTGLLRTPAFPSPLCRLQITAGPQLKVSFPTCHHGSAQQGRLALEETHVQPDVKARSRLIFPKQSNILLSCRLHDISSDLTRHFRSQLLGQSAKTNCIRPLFPQLRSHHPEPPQQHMFLPPQDLHPVSVTR